MAKGPERKIEDWFVAGMTHHGYLNLKGDAAAEKFTGWSDRVFFGHGPRTVVVEFKRDGAPKKRRGEKLQDYMRAQLRKRKYEVYKVVGWAQAYEVFALITGEVYDSRGRGSYNEAEEVVHLAIKRKTKDHRSRRAIRRSHSRQLGILRS